MTAKIEWFLVWKFKTGHEAWVEDVSVQPSGNMAVAVTFDRRNAKMFDNEEDASCWLALQAVAGFDAKDVKVERKRR